MSEIQLLQTFKTQIINFLDELIQQFPNEHEFIIIRVFVKDQIPLADVLGRFIKMCLPFQEQIDNRDEAFFLESDLISNALGGSAIGTEVMNKLKGLWRSNNLDNDDREMIWTWMSLFFQIASKYKSKYGFVEGWEQN